MMVTSNMLGKARLTAVLRLRYWLIGKARSEDLKSRVDRELERRQEAAFSN